MSSPLLQSYLATPQTNEPQLPQMRSSPTLFKATAHHRLALLTNSIAPSSKPSTAPRSRMSTSSFPPHELRSIVKEVATLLKDRKETISVAETVTLNPHTTHPVQPTNPLSPRQPAASSPPRSSPSPAPAPSTKAGSHCTRWRAAKRSSGGPTQTRRTTRARRPRL